MKVLINAEFKAIRKGDYVEANTEAEEFIIDTENCELAKSALKEVAKKNKVKLGSKDNAETILEKLGEAFEANEKMPQQNEMTDSAKVAAIVAQGVEDGDSDEDMIVAIINAGIKYKAANKLFSNALAAGGYRVTSKERKEEAKKILVEMEFEPETYEDVQKAVASVCEKVSDTDEGQALKAIRAYCREFDIELPKIPKPPKGGLKKQVMDWIIENPTAEVSDLHDFIVEEKEKDEKYVEKYTELLSFANSIVENLYDEEETEREEESETEEDETED